MAPAPGSAYLARPAHAPLRRRGSSWGDIASELILTGGPYRLVGLAAAQAQSLTDRFGEAIRESVTAAREAVDVRVFRRTVPSFRWPDLRGCEYEPELTYAPRELLMAGLGMLGSLRLGPRAAAALWTCHPGGEPFAGAVENLLRALCCYRALERDGVLLHSAAVLVDGEAWVAVASSGGGKTTFARMCAGAGLTVLSDDLNAVFVEGQRVLVEQVPFAGDLGRQRSVAGRFPLVGLCLLTKGDSDSLCDVGVAAAVASLLAHAPVVNADPWRAGGLTELAARLADRCRVARLTFALNGRPWSILHR